MSDQWIFWLCIAGMLAVFLLFFAASCFGLFRAPREVDTVLLNRTVYQDQLDELQQDFNRHAISETQYRLGVDEIERRILEESASQSSIRVQSISYKPVLPILLFAPLLAVGIYFAIGNPSLVEFVAPQSNLSSVDSQGNVWVREGREPTVEELQAYLKESPKDVRAWLRLSSQLFSARHSEDALAAMDKAFELSPEKVGRNSDMIAERAFVMLTVNKPELIQKAKSELERALLINPEHVTAKEILGNIAYYEGNYRRAVKLWSDVLALLPEGSPESLRLLDAVSAAKNREMMGAY